MGTREGVESFAPYGFANGNPWVWRDPTGLMSLGELGAAISVRFQLATSAIGSAGILLGRRLLQFARRARDVFAGLFRVGRELVRRVRVRPLGRGSTANLSKGSRLPRTLKERLAVEETIGSPKLGRPLPVRMTDPRWPAQQGWVKMQRIVETLDGGRIRRINVHYVRNTVTGAVDDFKIVISGGP